VKPSPSTLLIALLAVSTVGASALAWYQHRKLLELQAVVLRHSEERDEWQKKFASLEREPLAFASEAPSESPAAESGDEASPASTDDAERRVFARGPGRGERGNPLATLMQDPEFARALMTQQKAALDLRYADLFRRLNLSPAQVDRLKELLIERQSAAADVMAAARAEGVDGRDAREQLRELVRSTQAETDEAIRGFLGEAGYDAYQTFERTQPQRTLVGQLETKLSYTGAPLQDTQKDQLVRILAETASQGGRGGPQNNVFIAGRGFNGPGTTAVPGGGGVTITDEAIARAQGILSQSQLSALRQMQAEQQAQRTMAEAVRNATRNNRDGNRNGTPATPAP
jgi:hypothetical protein